MSTEKETLVALRDSETHFRHILDAVLGFVAVLDTAGTLLEVNEAALRPAGLVRSDVVGRKFWDCYWWSHDPAVAATIEDAVRRAAAGERLRFDIPARILDDDRLLVDFMIAPVRDERGEILYLVPSGVDVTERREAEEALRRSETRSAFLLGLGDALRATSDAREMMAAAAERLGRHIGADRVGYGEVDDHDRFEIRTEWHREGAPVAAGRGGLEDFGPALVTELHSGRAVVIDDTTSHPLTLDERAVSYWGASPHAVVIAPLVKQDRLAAALYLYRQGAHRWTMEDVVLAGEVAERTWDAVERARAEEERDRERILLSTVLDALPVGVAIADADGQIYRDNELTRELWGVPLEAASWQDYADFVAWWPDSGERIRAEEWAMTRALQRGETTRDELILNQKFGSDERRYYLNNVAPFRDGEGRIIGGVAAMLDVTERLAAERELQRLTEDLEERVRERTRQVQELASRLSIAEQHERSRIAQVLHDDVQQILHALQIRTRLLAAAGSRAGAEDHLAAADDLLRRAVHATRTLTAEIDPPVLRDIGLAEAFRWLAQHNRERHGLAVDLDLDLDDLGHLDQGRRVMVFHSVRELLFNVAKHAGVDRADLVAGTPNGHLAITVRDAGRGFAPDEVFAQESPGFGLANIRERVRLSGGDLEVESRPGGGTRVTLVMPAEA